MRNNILAWNHMIITFYTAAKEDADFATDNEFPSQNREDRVIIIILFYL